MVEKIIEYDIKAVSVDPKQSRSIIKVPYPEHKKVKDALEKHKKLRVIIETIEDEENGN